MLDVALLRRLDAAGTRRSAQVPAEVAEAWRLVFASNGRMRAAAIAEHVGWSRRHLSERFRGVTGVPLKEAAGIARFEATRRRLFAPHRPPLVDIAVQCGYADQPHVAREWQALAGCTIGMWLRDELPFVQGQTPTGPSTPSG
ncbi:MAG TPA: helix-turn-helix domain-containing protein [Mycobacteriales bacterium]|nr:helix-turn-helix domain-containing protein [Mycobacteriales bacterium]